MAPVGFGLGRSGDSGGARQQFRASAHNFPVFLQEGEILLVDRESDAEAETLAVFRGLGSDVGLCVGADNHVRRCPMYSSGASSCVI